MVTKIASHEMDGTSTNFGLQNKGLLPERVFFSKNVGPKTRFIEEGEIASLVRGEIAPVAYLEGH